MRVLFLAVLFAFPLANLEAGEVKFLAWNVESGGNDPGTIAAQLGEFADYDVVGLVEVSYNNIDKYIKALGEEAGKDVIGVYSETGGGDRQLIVFNSNRFELLEDTEIDEFDGHKLNFKSQSGRWRFRSPLYVRLRDMPTGQEFIFMITHLARGDASARKKQAIGLRAWANDQEVPVILMGDQNIDYRFTDGHANAGYHELVHDDVLSWVQPDPFVDTNWADTNPSAAVRTDRYPNTILDMMLVSGEAKDWSPSSDVLIRDGDFPDSDKTSDHRPVAGKVELPEIFHAERLVAASHSSLTTEDMLAEILERLKAIEKEIEELQED